MTTPTSLPADFNEFLGNTGTVESLRTAIAAGRLLLQEVNRFAAARADFAFESTLSGMSYARHLAKWKDQGYRIEIPYLRLKSPQLALRRIAARVRQGAP